MGIDSISKSFPTTKKKKVTILDSEELQELDPGRIRSVWILTEGGHFLIKTAFPDEDDTAETREDAILFAGFISAFRAFTDEITRGGDALQSFRLGTTNYHAYLSRPNGVFFVVESKNLDDVEAMALLSQIEAEFGEHYTGEVIRDWDGDLSVLDDFEIPLRKIVSQWQNRNLHRIKIQNKQGTSSLLLTYLQPEEIINLTVKLDDEIQHTFSGLESESESVPDLASLCDIWGVLKNLAVPEEPTGEVFIGYNNKWFVAVRFTKYEIYLTTPQTVGLLRLKNQITSLIRQLSDTC